MKKQLLTALLAVAGLSLIPSAEARCRRGACPTRECPDRCAPKCDSHTEIVGYKYYPCCRTEVVRGYKKCPVKRTTTTCVRDNTVCCKNEMSCCIFPESEQFSDAELNQAHQKQGDPRVVMADSVSDLE